jgi:hypothetical protein
MRATVQSTILSLTLSLILSFIPHCNLCYTSRKNKTETTHAASGGAHLRARVVNKNQTDRHTTLDLTTQQHTAAHSTHTPNSSTHHSTTPHSTQTQHTAHIT